MCRRQPRGIRHRLIQTTATAVALTLALPPVAGATPGSLASGSPALRQVGLEETGEGQDSPRAQLAQALNVPPAALARGNQGIFPRGAATTGGLEEGRRYTRRELLAASAGGAIAGALVGAAGKARVDQLTAPPVPAHLPLKIFVIGRKAGDGGEPPGAFSRDVLLPDAAVRIVQSGGRELDRVRFDFVLSPLLTERDARAVNIARRQPGVLVELRITDVEGASAVTVSPTLAGQTDVVASRGYAYLGLQELEPKLEPGKLYLPLFSVEAVSKGPSEAEAKRVVALTLRATLVVPPRAGLEELRIVEDYGDVRSLDKAFDKARELYAAGTIQAFAPSPLAEFQSGIRYAYLLDYIMSDSLSGRRDMRREFAMLSSEARRILGRGDYERYRLLRAIAPVGREILRTIVPVERQREKLDVEGPPGGPRSGLLSTLLIIGLRPGEEYHGELPTTAGLEELTPEVFATLVQELFPNGRFEIEPDFRNIYAEAKAGSYRLGVGFGPAEQTLTVTLFKSVGDDVLHSVTEAPEVTRGYRFRLIHQGTGRPLTEWLEFSQGRAVFYYEGAGWNKTPFVVEVETPVPTPALAPTPAVPTPQPEWLTIPAFRERYAQAADDIAVDLEVDPASETFWRRFREVGVVESDTPPPVTFHAYVAGDLAIDDAVRGKLAGLPGVRSQVGPLPVLVAIERPGIVFRQAGMALGRAVEDLQGMAVVDVAAETAAAVTYIRGLQAEAIVAVGYDPRLLPNLARLDALIVTVEDRPGHWVTAIFV